MSISFQQSHRLDFLFNAGHEMFTQCPSMSRYYINQFQQTLTEYELTIAKNAERLSCKRCGQILVSGLTNNVKIVKAKNKKNKKNNNKNKIQSTCSTCKDVQLYHGSFRNKMLAPKASSGDNSLHGVMSSKGDIIKSVPIVTKNDRNNTTTAVATGADQKKKKTKGNKKNTLKALLSKQNTTSGGSDSSPGGLSDFLSSL